jgi:hypothetical protein
MLTVYSERHRLHHGHAELIDGEMKPCFEMPSRADFIWNGCAKRSSAT